MRAMVFFASLRGMFAFDRALDAMGEIAIKVIKDSFIPALKKAVEAAEASGNETEADRLDKMLELYEIFSDPRRQESKIFSKTAAGIIRNRAKQQGMGEDGADELAQQISVLLYTSGQGVNRLLKIDPTTQPPTSFNKLWMRIVDGQTIWYLRDYRRHNPDVFLKQEKLEDDDRDVLDTIAAPDAKDEISPDELFDKMKVYVHAHARDQLTRDLYDAWMDAVQTSDRVVRLDSVYPALIDKFNVSRSSLGNKSMELKRLIHNFLQDVRDYTISDRVKKRLHMSSVDVVATEIYWRKVAAWILGLE